MPTEVTVFFSVDFLLGYPKYCNHTVSLPVWTFELHGYDCGPWVVTSYGHEMLLLNSI